MNNSIMLQFLGTAAADFSQKLLDECKNCFDKDARRSSSAILAGRYLIDCGPHTLDSLRIAGISPECITDLFMTHLHGDHFEPKSIEVIASAKAEPLRIWVSEEAELPFIKNTTVVKMPKLETLSVNASVKVTGLYANHEPEVFPQFLYFEINGKKLLYATDGGWMLHKTFNFLRGKHIDVAALDCTFDGYLGGAADHNSIDMLRVLLPSLTAVEAFDEHTSIYLTHIAPSWHKPHAILTQTAADIGALVAYDGLCVEF